MKRCVIVGGADIRNYARIRGELQDEYFIFCDSGLRHQKKLSVSPDLIVGDFDSHKEPVTDTEVIRLPCEKDDTDTLFAIKEALRRGYRDFLLIGVTGGRLDHTLANVYALLLLDESGAHGRIVDDYSDMELVKKERVFVSPKYPFFSLLAIEGPALDVTIKNAKYPLANARILPSFQYAVSNEVLPGMEAEVSCESGRLLLCRIYEPQSEG